MLKVFIGYDPRQPVAYNVMQHSIARYSSVPVQITPLILNQLPMNRQGLTQFTYSRFLVPYLCGFEGKALFVDPDMVCLGDIKELFDAAGDEALSVVKAQPKFEWPSLMLFNNEKCKALTPDYIDNPENKLFELAWADEIGELPKEWNCCVGYEPVPDEAKLIHWTMGLPCWYETADQEAAEVWHEQMNDANMTVPWQKLMGKSIHAKETLNRLFKRLCA